LSRAVRGIGFRAALTALPAMGVVLGALTTASAASAPQAGNALRGKTLYEARCGGCHSLEANRVGPAHRGVVGRRVASAPGFDYSPAIKRLGGVWTAERLDRWLAGPQRLAPGSRMFLVVDDPADRRDLIAWLAANPAPCASRTC
jgi:cytochrome c